MWWRLPIGRTVNLGPLPVLLAVFGAPLALFRRKAKDDWLGELDGIRGNGVGDLRPDDDDDDEREAAKGGTAGVAAPVAGPRADDSGGTHRDQPSGPAVPAPPPAPHRDHPSELWHAPLEMSGVTVPPPIVPEESLDPADLVEPTADDGSLGPVGAAATRAPGGGDAAGGPGDPFVEVLAGEGLLDDARPWDARPDDAVADHADHAPDRRGDETGRRRVKPPIDIFDHMPLPDLDQIGAGTNGDTGGTDVDGDVDVAAPASGRDLIGGPVGRRPSGGGRTRRSLFGAEGTPTIIGTANAAEGRPLLVRDDGMVETDLGIIRLSERSRPEVVLNAQGVSLAVEAGWCWVALTRTGLPVSVAVPGGAVVVAPGTRLLTVVESDHSAFISLVSGSAVLEGSSGSVELAAGAIAHVPVSGRITLDRATPDEMATDVLLTRNLRLDDEIHPGSS